VTYCGRRFTIGLAAYRIIVTHLRNILLTALIASTAAAQSMPVRLTTFLSGTVGFTDDEVARAGSGTAVVKVLSTTDSREVALVGADRVDVPRAFYVARVAVAGPSSGDSSSSRLFSDPAVPGDVGGFALTHNDVENLLKCRPGSCKLKLPGTAMVAMRAGLDPASASVDSAASAAFGQRMIDYVNTYRTHGNAALVEYDDQPKATGAAQVWDGMLSQSPYVYTELPSLARYLNEYPRERPPGMRDAIFWTQEDIPGAQPLVTVTHQVVYDPPEMTGATVVASKQLYCDHYLDGEFDLMAIIDPAPSGGDQKQAAYVVFIRRLHFDDLPSGGIVNIRGKVVGKTRDMMQQQLRDTKRASEQAFASAH
jgi:hypothetical protein